MSEPILHRLRHETLLGVLTLEQGREHQQFFIGRILSVSLKPGVPILRFIY